MSNETKFKIVLMAIIICTGMSGAAFGYAIAPTEKVIASFGMGCISTLLMIVWLISKFDIVVEDEEVNAIKERRKALEKEIKMQSKGRRRVDRSNAQKEH